MTTFGSMRTRIADEMANDGDITSAQIGNAIKTAIKHYEREGFWFNTKSATFSTVAAQEFYGSADLSDIPSMVRIDSLTCNAGTASKYPVKGVDNSAIDDIQDGSVTGDPTFYSRLDNTIRLYPIPSSVRTMQARYVYKLPALSGNSDTNAWVDECEEMTRQAAKRILCTDILHVDDMASRFAALERAAYDKIRRENRLRQPQRMLRADLPFGAIYGVSTWR